MASKTPSYNINYNDKRFTQVNKDKKQALNEVEKTYGGMIGQADKYYQQQIDASKQWGETQQKLQQENTDFAIEKIEQQKEQAHKDYIKEQSGAYADWQKQSNQYGAKAEQMASQGMVGTGFSESSQVSMFNAYQNRVATARESYNNAVLNYNNAIKDAQLQNNSKLAEIAYQSLQEQLELSLQGFQYKNTLLLDKLSKRQEVDNTYYGRYQDVLSQINTENALKEQIRQHNESMAFQRKEAQREQARWEKEFAEQKRQFNVQNGGSSGGGRSSKKSSKKSSSSSGKKKTQKQVKKGPKKLKKGPKKYVAKETGTERTKSKGTSGYVSVKKKTNEVKTYKARSVKNKKKANSLNSIKANSLLNIKF